MKKKVLTYCFLAAALLVLFSGCKKKKQETQPIEYGTMTDIDNNTYVTVKIGNQWWMAENLKVKHYRNGAPISEAYQTDPDSAWANKIKGSWCKYYNDDNNAKTYGLLYNWFAISDTSNIAPAGWHVPSDDEWKELEGTLGMAGSDLEKVNWRGSDQADKMRVESPDGWTRYGSVWSTNASGFGALAGSCRLFNGIWGDPGIFATGFWWTSSSHPDNKAWYRYLDYKKSNVFRYYGPRTYGMSIRCVKD
jgi:uncharacterized protein (TIGR02145 family)